MKLEFYKYHGTGNDFILIDNRLNEYALTTAQITFLCDRHRGIGADGLMLFNINQGYDFGMRYFNSDGNESTMCGNGGRCMTALAMNLGIGSQRMRFHAIDGEHEAFILWKKGNDAMVRLKMNDTKIDRQYPDGIFLNTGSPHFVHPTTGVEIKDVLSDGRSLRYDPRFASGGTNVDFVEQHTDSLYVRSYERGVESETLSCGTGVTAAALATAFLNPDNPGMYHIKTPGGLLQVTFKQSGSFFSEIWLQGPATFVFASSIEI